MQGVKTPVGQRRRSSEKEAFWHRHVQEQAKSGLGVRAYCQQEQLAENSFYAWRRELERRRPANTTPQGFTELVVAPRLTSNALELVIGQRRVVIPPGFDPASLRAVLEVLEA